MGENEGTMQFTRYLNAMLELGRDRGKEDADYAQTVMGQFVGQLQLG